MYVPDDDDEDDIGNGHSYFWEYQNRSRISIWKLRINKRALGATLSTQLLVFDLNSHERNKVRETKHMS